jgi:hypothetical protein
MNHRVAFLLVLITAAPAFSQSRPDPEALLDAQRGAMEPLAFLDGAWRGPAWTITPEGERVELTQTERVGTFLDGSVRIIEGRGYRADGSVGFNALAILSFDPGTTRYTLHSYAHGQVGDFAFTPRDDGYTWEIPAGPMIIRYTAVFEGGTWRETGDRIVPGQEPVRFFEMTLTRLGDTDWPAAGSVPLK